MAVTRTPSCARSIMPCFIAARAQPGAERTSTVGDHIAASRAASEVPSHGVYEQARHGVDAHGALVLVLDVAHALDLVDLAVDLDLVACVGPPAARDALDFGGPRPLASTTQTT